ncbi:MAG: formate dehydrogenase subunit delta [bacterium]|nr:formate dehydrogenase subunit delta [bacterium]
MDANKLVNMANQIAAFFSAEPDRKDAVAGVAGHLRKFWDPRMRREILAHFDAGGDGMESLVRDALEHYRDDLAPAG